MIGSMTNFTIKPQLSERWQPEIINDKVIFLDVWVDGVLNCQMTDRIFHGFIFLDIGKIAVLRELVDRTGAQIVLSSTWRADYYWAEQGGVQQRYNLFELLRSELDAQGIKISDLTADVWDSRGLEIKSYLDDHPQIKHIVVLDDDNCYPLSKYQIKTDWKYGLLQHHISRAENILKEEYSITGNYVVRVDYIGNEYIKHYKDGSSVRGLREDLTSRDQTVTEIDDLCYFN